MKWRCPYCRQEVEVQRLEDLPFMPFCSERCKMADLHGWLSGRYVISRPMEEGDFGEASSPEDGPSPPAAPLRGDPSEN
jgi:endogenous inhibitor of DNA gyrase (YacG/DUF329 family)